MNCNRNCNKDGRRRVLINVVSLVAVFVMMAAASISYSGRLFGYQVNAGNDADKSESRAMQTSDTQGDAVIKTDALGLDVNGYAGPVPVAITISGGRVNKVEALENSETPKFFKRVTNAGLLDSWNGLTPKEALDKKVDAVTGATYTSRALIANVHAGLEYYQGQEITSDMAVAEKPGLELYAALIVVLMAMIIPLFVKNKRYRIVQQLLNAGVLGFWCGTFVDYTMMLGWLGGGAVSWASAVPLLMLVAAFIYPLFGRDGYYCAWVCPLGSLQELATRCHPNRRLHQSAGTVKWLTRFRMLLWGALMLCLWTGLWVRWIDYELFTAFFVTTAAWGILVAGAIVIVLSAWIPRPYCRFVCPAGTLLRMSQNIDTH